MVDDGEEKYGREVRLQVEVRDQLPKAEGAVKVRIGGLCVCMELCIDKIGCTFLPRGKCGSSEEASLWDFSFGSLWD